MVKGMTINGEVICQCKDYIVFCDWIKNSKYVVLDWGKYIKYLKQDGGCVIVREK
mgnify:CR=1 FL=1